MLPHHWRDLPISEVTPDSPLLSDFDRLFVISDTHFHHHRLTEVLAPGSRPDDFTEQIFASWQATIQPDDLVLHLGDVTVGKLAPFDYNQFIPPLPGRVFLLPGNHDRRPAKLQAYLDRGWTLIHPFYHLWHDQVLAFTHEPLNAADLPGIDLNVHGHTHNHLLDPARYLNCCVEHIGLAPTPLLPRLLAWEQQFRP